MVPITNTQLKLSLLCTRTIATLVHNTTKCIHLLNPPAIISIYLIALHPYKCVHTVYMYFATVNATKYSDRTCAKNRVGRGTSQTTVGEGHVGREGSCGGRGHVAADTVASEQTSRK